MCMTLEEEKRNKEKEKNINHDITTSPHHLAHSLNNQPRNIINSHTPSHKASKT